MTKVLYLVEYCDYDSSIPLGVYSSLHKALDWFLRNDGEENVEMNANRITVMILDTEEHFSLYYKSLDNEDNMNLMDLVQLTRIDSFNDDEKKVFELKKIMARYAIKRYTNLIKKGQKELNDMDLNDKQIAFKEYQIQRWTEEKNKLMKKYVKEVVEE